MNNKEAPLFQCFKSIKMYFSKIRLWDSYIYNHSQGMVNYKIVFYNIFAEVTFIDIYHIVLPWPCLITWEQKNVIL
jgi:hypothetical protein